jgi:hypothetical protein
VTKREAVTIIAKHQRALNLGEWTIVPLIVPGGTCDEDGDWGRISYNVQRLEAVIELPQERTAAETEQTICHELAHLLLREYEGIVRRALYSLPKVSRELALNLLHEAEERLCNRVARAMSGVEPGPLRDPAQFVAARE